MILINAVSHDEMYAVNYNQVIIKWLLETNISTKIRAWSNIVSFRSQIKRHVKNQGTQAQAKLRDLKLNIDKTWFGNTFFTFLIRAETKREGGDI